MNRMFLAAALGVAALAGLAGPALALWPFHCCSPSKKCGADFCIRQYNAFSPVCHGTVFCDGIHPFAGPGYPGAVSPRLDSFASHCPTCQGGPVPGAPMMGHPGMGAPGMAMPGYGAPMHGMPGYGAPMNGMPGYGAPMYGPPMLPPPNAAPPMGLPPAGQPGFPPMGQPGFPPPPGVAPPMNYHPGFPPRPMVGPTPIATTDGSSWMIPAAPIMPVAYPGYPEQMPVMMPYPGQ